MEDAKVEVFGSTAKLQHWLASHDHSNMKHVGWHDGGFVDAVESDLRTISNQMHAAGLNTGEPSKLQVVSVHTDNGPHYLIAPKGSIHESRKTFKTFLRESNFREKVFPGAEFEGISPDFQANLLASEHDDEAEDQAMVRRMVKPDCLQDHDYTNHDDELVYETAPPGYDEDKMHKMKRAMIQQYGKEKGEKIAFATAWKQHNADK